MSLVDFGYYLGWTVLLGVALAGCWRMLAGPTTLDRMVGFDTLTITITALIVMVSVYHRTSEFMELILIMTGLGFFTTVAFFYYLSQPRSDQQDELEKEERR